MITGKEMSNFVAFKCSSNCSRNNQVDYMIRESDINRHYNSKCPLCGNPRKPVVVYDRKVINK